MRWYYKLPLRLRSLFRKDRAELDLSDELQFHLQNQIDEFVAQGMNPQEARQAARQSLGGVEQVKEECRDMRRTNLVDNFLQDVRFGFRILRRSPGFTVLTILCLTLGVGANASVFSWVEGILLRPYPLVSHQERLVTLTGTVRDERDETSWPDLLDVQRSCTLCETLFVSKITGATLSIGERAQLITGSIVSANYFDAIGVHPILGRGFEPGEDTGRNAHPLVVISYHLWQTRFKGDPEIIGKRQRFDNVVHTIIGVAPEGFYGTFVGRSMEYWVPASMLEVFDGGSDKLEDRGARWAEAYVRLKPGVTRNQAQQEISAIAARLEAEYPATNRGRGIKVWPLWQTPFNHAGHLLPTFEIMVVVTMFVLLIVCANVGNLLIDVTSIACPDAPSAGADLSACSHEPQPGHESRSAVAKRHPQGLLLPLWVLNASRRYSSESDSGAEHGFFGNVWWKVSIMYCGSPLLAG
jgi:macrolide transport system ATP-binding/permease protein